MSQSSRLRTSYATPTRPIIIPQASFTLGAIESIVTRVVTDNEGNEIHLERGQFSRGDYFDDRHRRLTPPDCQRGGSNERRYYVEERRSFETTQTRENRKNVIEGRNLEDDFDQAGRGDGRRARSPSVKILPSTEEERMQRIRALKIQKQELEEEQRRLRMDVIRFSPPRRSPRNGRSHPYRHGNDGDGNRNDGGRDHRNDDQGRRENHRQHRERTCNNDDGGGRNNNGGGGNNGGNDNDDGDHLDDGGQGHQNDGRDHRDGHHDRRYDNKDNEFNYYRDENDSLKERLEKMEKAFMGGGVDTYSTESPLVREIRDYVAATSHTIPKMSNYYGKGDPLEHVTQYERQMKCACHDQIIMCQLFEVYLKDSAQGWYRTLKPNSIWSYEQLRGEFLRHYAYNRRVGQHTATLINARQRPDESMTAYVKRFKQECEKVIALDESQAMGFFCGGLDLVKSRKLLKSFIAIAPTSINEMYARAENIRMREEALGDVKDTPKKNDQTVFTLLNTSRSRILNEIKNGPGFEKPPKINVPDYRKNTKKYCEYHEDTGHTTEDCFNLKGLIEKLIKDGELKKFIAKDKEQRKEAKDK